MLAGMYGGGGASTACVCNQHTCKCQKCTYVVKRVWLPRQRSAHTKQFPPLNTIFVSNGHPPCTTAKETAGWVVPWLQGIMVQVGWPNAKSKFCTLPQVLSHKRLSTPLTLAALSQCHMHSTYAHDLHTINRYNY